MSSCPTEARTQTAAPDRWQEAFDALERRVTSHPLFPQLVHHVATDESHTFLVRPPRPPLGPTAASPGGAHRCAASRAC